MSLLPLGWSHYLVGGLVIGCGVALLYVLTGLVGGMSSVYSSTWSWIVKRPFFQQPRLVDSRVWRIAYAVGLIIGAAAWMKTLGHGTRVVVSVAPWQLFVGGLVGGFGARLSGGCTSGHGICGIASLKLPSLGAVLMFMTTAFITAQFSAHWMGK